MKYSTVMEDIIPLENVLKTKQKVKGSKYHKVTFSVLIEVKGFI